MKKILLLLLTFAVLPFLSCGDDDDKTQTLDPENVELETTFQAVSANYHGAAEANPTVGIYEITLKSVRSGNETDLTLLLYSDLKPESGIITLPSGTYDESTSPVRNKFQKGIDATSKLGTYFVSVEPENHGTYEAEKGIVSVLYNQGIYTIVASLEGPDGEKYTGRYEGTVNFKDMSGGAIQIMEFPDINFAYYGNYVNENTINVVMTMSEGDLSSNGPFRLLEVDMLLPLNYDPYETSTFAGNYIFSSNYDNQFEMNPGSYSVVDGEIRLGGSIYFEVTEPGDDQQVRIIEFYSGSMTIDGTGEFYSIYIQFLGQDQSGNEVVVICEYQGTSSFTLEHELHRCEVWWYGDERENGTWTIAIAMQNYSQQNNLFYGVNVTTIVPQHPAGWLMCLQPGQYRKDEAHTGEPFTYWPGYTSDRGNLDGTWYFRSEVGYQYEYAYRALAVNGSSVNVAYNYDGIWTIRATFDFEEYHTGEMIRNFDVQFSGLINYLDATALQLEEEGMDSYMKRMGYYDDAVLSCVTNQMRVLEHSDSVRPRTFKF